MKPLWTSASHVLPFEKLSPLDFERLSLWLLEAEDGFGQIEHFGASGSDQGRDIVARKNGELWVLQCKRVRNFSLGDAKCEIAKLRALPQAEQPGHVVFVLACELTARVRRSIQKEWGCFDSCHFWTPTQLDYWVKSQPRILREFFGVADTHEGQSSGSSTRPQTRLDMSVDCGRPGPLRLLKLYSARYCRFLPEQQQNGVFSGVLYVGDERLEGIHVHPRFINHLNERGYPGARFGICIEGNFFWNSVMFLSVDGDVARQNSWKYFGEILAGLWLAVLSLGLAMLGISAYISTDFLFLLLMPLFFIALALYVLSFAAQRVDLLLLLFRRKLDPT